MQKLENRKDIEHLVNSFYGKIRGDELLGPIFNKHIAEHEWPAHLSKLTDFWEMKLLGGAQFKGSPSQKHIDVDKASNFTIDQGHFSRWLQIWLETVNELFEGPLAERAKAQARKMATGQYISIWQNRPSNQK